MSQNHTTINRAKRITASRPVNTSQHRNNQHRNPPPQKNIRHKKVQKQSTHAPERRRLAIFGHDGNIDITLFTVVIVLLIIGVAMMFSASYFWALSEFNDGYYYLKKQGIFAIGGIVAMVLLSKLDYHFFQNTRIAYFSFIILLLLNFITAFVGVNVAGARRWFIIPGLGSFQPSELLKVAFIIIIAYILSANYPYFDKIGFSIVPCAAIIAFVDGVMVLQRHMSALLIFTALGILLMFFGGVKMKHLGLFVGVLGALGVLLVGYKMFTATGNDSGFGYISNRLYAWKHPESDILGKTNQIWNSLVAIGSGGITGVGLGESKQKFLWLSESQNDFVFAIVCEELGLIGALLVILLFCLFVARGVSVSAKAPDRFGMLLSAGITMHIGIQAFMNIAVATNTIPNTGISLPFFSYGGTALLVQLAEVGLLLSVSRKTTNE